MKLNDLHKLTSDFKNTETLPVLFYGHGSPMNAIENNLFTQGWKESIKNLPIPSAIICISAHWETKGTFVTAMQQPRTIHDFGGFPQELFAVQYKAPGSPDLALETQKIIQSKKVGLDSDWGLDHGCWSVVKHLYPDASVPIIQLSLDRNQGPAEHYRLAKELAVLRNKGILIIGSGNMVHNLGMIDWNNPQGGFDWAVEANHEIKKFIMQDDHLSLIDYKNKGRAFQLSIPTPEHYLPLLYTLGLKQKNEEVIFFNDKTQMGSISMTSLKIEKHGN